MGQEKAVASTMELREIEGAKTNCASEFFDEMNRRIALANLKYDMPDVFGKLMEVLK